MITLFSPKGGVGRTTLAYNLAVAFGIDHKVCLVDGSMQFSDLRGLLRAPADAPSIVNLPTDKIRDADLCRRALEGSVGDRGAPRATADRDGRDGHRARHREGALHPPPDLRA